MKYIKIFGIIILLCLIINAIGCLKPNKILYNEGTYEGIAQGHIGPIKVLVETDKYEIINITILEEYEMPEVSKHVYDKIPNKIIRKNSADVDVISGATYTSNGLISAIKDALSKASFTN